MKNKDYIERLKTDPVMQEYNELKKEVKYWYDRIHYLSAYGGSIDDRYIANNSFNKVQKDLELFLEKEYTNEL